MRLLLLGPNGQLGRDIRAAAAAQGMELTAVDRARLDLADPAAIVPALEPLAFDVLINATGYHRTDEAEDRAELAFRINAHAVRELARLCQRKGAWLVHISTDYVFSGLDRTVPYRETDGCEPLNVYGASKLMGEGLARLEGERTLILRVASLFGVAGASGKGGNFVETMLRLARERGHLRVVDDTPMSPTATADVAAALLKLLRADPEPGIYHAVNDGSATWCGFAREIVRLAGVPCRVEAVTSAEYPTRAVRPRYSVLDPGKLAARVGPLPPWPEALARYLRAKGHIA